jgi:hypothetical protein
VRRRIRPTPAQHQLWRELGEYFAEDDGTLPEYWFSGLSPEGAARIFDELRERADPPEPSTTIWHDEREEQLPLAEVPDAGALVTSGRIGSLHVVLSGVRSAGIRLPDLGVSLFRDSVELDYRMGRDWNPIVLSAFVDLLIELQQLDPGSRLDAHADADVQEQFREAIERYLVAAR